MSNNITTNIQSKNIDGVTINKKVVYVHIPKDKNQDVSHVKVIPSKAVAATASSSFIPINTKITAIKKKPNQDVNFEPVIRTQQTTSSITLTPRPGYHLPPILASKSPQKFKNVLKRSIIKDQDIMKTAREQCNLQSNLASSSDFTAKVVPKTAFTLPNKDSVNSFATKFTPKPFKITSGVVISPNQSAHQKGKNLGPTPKLTLLSTNSTTNLEKLRKLSKSFGNIGKLNKITANLPAKQLHFVNSSTQDNKNQRNFVPVSPNNPQAVVSYERLLQESKVDIFPQPSLVVETNPPPRILQEGSNLTNLSKKLSLPQSSNFKIATSKVETPCLNIFPTPSSSLNDGAPINLKQDSTKENPTENESKDILQEAMSAMVSDEDFPSPDIDTKFPENLSENSIYTITGKTKINGLIIDSLSTKTETREENSDISAIPVFNNKISKNSDTDVDVKQEKENKLSDNKENYNSDKYKLIDDELSPGDINDYNIQQLLKWDNGVGSLSGTDLKFRYNEFGAFELIEDDGFARLKNRLTDLANLLPPSPPEEKKSEEFWWNSSKFDTAKKDSEERSESLNSNSKLKIEACEGNTIENNDVRAPSITTTARHSRKPHFASQPNDDNRQTGDQSFSRNSSNSSGGSTMEVLCCESCGCYGLNAEFIRKENRVFCTDACSQDYKLREAEWIKEQQRVEKIKNRLKKKEEKLKDNVKQTIKDLKKSEIVKCENAVVKMEKLKTEDKKDICNKQDKPEKIIKKEPENVKKPDKCEEDDWIPYPTDSFFTDGKDGDIKSPPPKRVRKRRRFFDELPSQEMPKFKGTRSEDKSKGMIVKSNSNVDQNDNSVMRNYSPEVDQVDSFSRQSSSREGFTPKRNGNPRTNNWNTKGNLPPSMETLVHQSIFNPGYNPAPCHRLPLVSNHAHILGDIVVDQNPLDVLWDTTGTYEAVGTVPGCSDVAEVLKREGMDAEALRMVTQQDLVGILGLKLGPALKITALGLWLRGDRG